MKKNNPFNIKNSPTNEWQGKISNENDTFESYSSLYAGYRAFIITISNYNDLHGLFTISQIINRYAPETDNNPTKSYISFVSDYVGASNIVVSEDFPTFLKFAKAVAFFESNHVLFDELFTEVYYTLKAINKI